MSRWRTIAMLIVGAAVMAHFDARDGRLLSHQVKGVPGDANNPVSQDVLEEKFRDCASFAITPVKNGNIEKVIGLIADLENVPDATEAMRLLS